MATKQRVQHMQDTESSHSELDRVLGPHTEQEVAEEDSEQKTKTVTKKDKKKRRKRTQEELDSDWKKVTDTTLLTAKKELNKFYAGITKLKRHLKVPANKMQYLQVNHIKDLLDGEFNIRKTPLDTLIGIVMVVGYGLKAASARATDILKEKQTSKIDANTMCEIVESMGYL